MEGYMYARIPAERMPELKVTAPRTEVDGYVIVSQNDLVLFGEPGQSLTEKVTALGGELLTAFQAKGIINTNNKAK